MKITGTTALSAAILALAFSAAHAFAAEESQAALKAEANITQAQAQATALAKVPDGTIKSSELEREHGRLIWSFDVARPSSKGVTEVQVDAKTGKIVLVKRETSAQEAKEAKAEKSVSR